jgi:adenylyltransferase/sulfurtransferase
LYGRRVAEVKANLDRGDHFVEMRSAKARGILRQAGFQHMLNMKGGILAWADKVDPSVPKY